MKRAFLALSLLALASCANGPVAGTSALAHGAGALIVEALPPGLHSLGEMAVNALISLSEQQGWTREQFVTALQEADIAAGEVPGQPRAVARTSDPKAVARVADYLATLKSRGR